MSLSSSKPLFTIRVVVAETGLHPQTIRSYESKGLVEPARTDGGTRMYSQMDVDRLLEIAELSSQGVGIAGIAKILELEHRISELEVELAETKRDRDAAIAAVEASKPEPLAIILRPSRELRVR